jgi:response regulator RpfG family c-di-GMP phosphodiesterase
VGVSSKITDAERVSIMLYDREKRQLVIRAAIGLPREVLRGPRQALGQGIAGQVAMTRQPMRADRFGLVGEHRAMTENRSYQRRSFLSVPILVGDELFAVLNLTDKRSGDEFTDKDEELICNLAQKSSIKLENNALYEGIYTNMVDTLRALVTMIEARDPYTHRHSQRVTDYAVALGRFIGMREEDLETLEFTGILHDIGKIGIQDKILHKPGRLTVDEMTHIKAHPVIGETIVKPLGLIDIERSLIRHHHERFDGQGYPDGLRGDVIPLLVRVLSVADSFDAMTSNRPYRMAMSVADAMEGLRQSAGTQFDPDVVDAMDRALTEEAIPLPSNHTLVLCQAG